MTIVLTAGHSNLDPGAVNGLAREADIAVDMRNIISHILRADYGLTVKTDGINRTNLPLKDAIKLIRGAKLAIEFHCNAATNKTATGIEALTVAKNKETAQALCKSVADITGWKLRGDKGYKPDNAGQHSRLGYAQSGGIIFEPFFISNDEDLAVWYAKKWLICRAIASTIAGLVSIRG
ncbi:N-acetylmuramoyl-L-alanine amidase [Moraxella nasicaprae]|uniref:N-acetylmuramoyl-L-alanine amidase n=1 Tax=Moraxella nasicaprae TaxID=2904122 RepID=A0ABY6F410_9GAMM|nr:N-acetylmuramoyl-L-alanine amidase [Moraxella nasicaprae]UXZ04825.1 N-acetylmuramoyl-L-alanine amidase [Moraxella nasicaprae]